VLSNIRNLTNGGVRFIAVTQGLDVQPHGDAMSQLILGVLAAVSEFERSLVAERTALAAKVAREAGRCWGRRPGAGPQPSEVRTLRAAGSSWSEIALRLGCTIGMARRRAAAAGRDLAIVKSSLPLPLPRQRLRS
jgi:DNA invertase Pin-like site-specific DNA recombinase